MILNLQGDTQGHGDNSEISEPFGRKIPNAILPFPCSFHHNSPGADYFFEDLDLLQPLVRKLFLHLKEATKNTSSMRKSILDVPVLGSS